MQSSTRRCAWKYECNSDMSVRWTLLPFGGWWTHSRGNALSCLEARYASLLVCFSYDVLQQLRIGNYNYNNLLIAIVTYIIYYILQIIFYSLVSSDLQLQLQPTESIKIKRRQLSHCLFSMLISFILYFKYTCALLFQDIVIVGPTHF